MLVGIWLILVVVVLVPLGCLLCRRHKKEEIRQHSISPLVCGSKSGVGWLLIIFIILGFVAVMIQQKYSSEKSPANKEYGITFSAKYAQELGLDPQEVMAAILDDLRVKTLRIPAYWDELEPMRGVWDFSNLDWQIEMVRNRGVKVILAMGAKVPRWPECHAPKWTDNLTDEQFYQEISRMLAEVVSHYKNNPTISMWQVENEALFRFGVCRKVSLEDLKKEIALVRSLDSRPIMTTDSGELSTWWKTYGLTDVLGTSVYRVVRTPVIGYWHYWFIPPYFYKLKADILKFFKGPIDIIVSELSCEPWVDGPIIKSTFAEQDKSMDIKQFKKNLDYARKLNFKSIYLWGAEWWYWRKVSGNSGYWDLAKEFFRVR